MKVKGKVRGCRLFRCSEGEHRSLFSAGGEFQSSCAETFPIVLYRLMPHLALVVLQNRVLEVTQDFETTWEAVLNGEIHRGSTCLVMDRVHDQLIVLVSMHAESNRWWRFFSLFDFHDRRGWLFFLEKLCQWPSLGECAPRGRHHLAVRGVDQLGCDLHTIRALDVQAADERVGVEGFCRLLYGFGLSRIKLVQVQLFQRRVEHCTIDDGQFTGEQELCPDFFRQELPEGSRRSSGVGKIEKGDFPVFRFHGSSGDLFCQLFETLLVARGGTG